MIGLATAEAPEGPWRKYEGNPILKLGGIGSWDYTSHYLGSVLKIEGNYYMWYVGFDEGNEKDGKLGLATAPAPEGPWMKCGGNPVLSAGPAGSWDEGQIGETAVFYADGLFHEMIEYFKQTNIT